MQTVTSRHNPLYKTLAAFKKDRGLMLLEGLRLVEDALSRGFTPRVTAASEGFPDINRLPLPPDMLLSEKLFEGIAETKTPQGILAFFDTPWADLREIHAQERVIILDGIQDPGNVGTIVRTAEAFGFSGMVITQGTANPFSSKAIRSSMGSCLGIKIARGGVEDLKLLPHRIISMTPKGKTRLSADLFKAEVAICLGQEAGGISEEILEISHETVAIPMSGRTESINVAVAAGIVMACAAGIL